MHKSFQIYKTVRMSEPVQNSFYKTQSAEDVRRCISTQSPIQRLVLLCITSSHIISMHIPIHMTSFLMPLKVQDIGKIWDTDYKYNLWHKVHCLKSFSILAFFNVQQWLGSIVIGPIQTGQWTVQTLNPAVSAIISISACISLKIFSHN